MNWLQIVLIALLIGVLPFIEIMCSIEENRIKKESIDMEMRRYIAASILTKAKDGRK